jgi:hypothetical protein
MMTRTLEDTAAPHSRELTVEECEQRLACASMGRVGWTVGGLQQILPVSFAMEAGRVVFRTSAYGVLAHLRQPTNVAFEIDEVDPAGGTGWSVVVQGSAQAVVLPQKLVDLWARPDIVPWAPGTRNLFIAITVQALSGRAVQAPFAI